MKYTRYILSGLFAGVVVFLTGCGYDRTAAEPPSARLTVDWAPDANFQAQADNAVLTSMVVTDIHFVPYRSKLNSLGRARLVAIASYLEQYGGEVTLESHQVDEVTEQERLATVREFLLKLGLDSEQLAVVTGLGTGRGQDAAEAKLFYEKNLFPEESSSTGQAVDPTAAASALSAGASQ